MLESKTLHANQRYRAGLLAMRGGVAVALLTVLVLPPGEAAIGLFALACLTVAWGAWQRHRHCPAYRGGRGAKS